MDVRDDGRLSVIFSVYGLHKLLLMLEAIPLQDGNYLSRLYAVDIRNRVHKVS
jgi:hypothetical protein